jgi:p-aminobenzoyl-glutamate transporter AbgT
MTLFVYLLALACWLGGMIFFALLMAPVVFSTLPISEAGKVMATLFPRYYVLGYIAGGIACVLAIYFTAANVARLWWGFTTVALVIALALTFYAGLIVRPQVDAIRTVNEEPNPDPARKAEFDRLHQLSVSLNGVVIVLNLLALATTAAALAPHV